jgi:hypothetical protein
MKNLDWLNISLIAFVVLMITFVTFIVMHDFNKNPNPNKGIDGGQKTINYVGFDGKKHQAIVVHCGTQNWVLVEKR